ncbi:MAG: acetyl ornithine aminotransferase family protein [Planctomycetota bacterium]|nr:acetyl ornithine aminotransferase family protein [Planctomycetota bacterium]MDE2216215.1 acetyl ornithine aminotransferase family protein [Planctomycetota bacterium]
MAIQNYPCIRTRLPGPNAIQYLEKEKKFISPSSTKSYPLVVKGAKGMVVTDVDDNTFLDFTSGVAVCNTGHNHDQIVASISSQANTLIHMSGADFYNPLQIQLAEKLSAICPGSGVKRTFFGNSGAEAVETAFKLARYHTKRSIVIAFYNAFHGRTMGALSLTASKLNQRKHFLPLIPEVIHIPYAYCYRCHYGLTPDKCNMACVTWIRKELFKTKVPPEDVAAIFVEVIQGEGGYVVPPKEFHKALYQLTRDYNILYVADEVQSGMGRTGRMFASEHFDIVPDIITIAKGIASGLPLSATVASEEVMDWVPGSHASTFGGNPVSCQVALATIKLLEDGLIDNAAKQGAYIMNELKRLERTYPIIGDVRGLGLMLAAEIVKDKETKEYAPEVRDSIIQRAFSKGLLLLSCGRSAIRFCPPLILSKNDADIALSIFEECLKETV